MTARLLEEAFGPAGRDLYALLGVRPDATEEQIRKGYHKAALRWHPDKNKGEANATLKFQALSAAHGILSDASIRRQFDETGSFPDNEWSGSDVSWRVYWRQVFPEFSVARSDDLKAKYVGSSEECDDVLRNYRKYDGDLGSVVASVMFSTEADLPRFEAMVESAIAAGKVNRLAGLDASKTGSAKAQRRSRKEAKQKSQVEASMGAGGFDELAAKIKARQEARISEGNCAGLAPRSLLDCLEEVDRGRKGRRKASDEPSIMRKASSRKRPAAAMA